MHKKNNHSSIGKPKRLIPIKYFSLNPQIPHSVKKISHIIKNVTVNKKLGANDRNLLKYLTRCSNEQAKGIDIAERLIAR